MPNEPSEEREMRQQDPHLHQRFLGGGGTIGTERNVNKEQMQCKKIKRWQEPV
jgi:hypothetical protein